MNLHGAVAGEFVFLPISERLLESWFRVPESVRRFHDVEVCCVFCMCVRLWGGGG